MGGVRGGSGGDDGGKSGGSEGRGVEGEGGSGGFECNRGSVRRLGVEESVRVCVLRVDLRGGVMKAQVKPNMMVRLRVNRMRLAWDHVCD